MGLDRLRYLILSREPSAWASQYEALRKRLGRVRSAPLDAMAAMARKEFAKADTLWREAMGYYRDQGRLAKVAACLNQSAICLFSLGRRRGGPGGERPGRGHLRRNWAWKCPA